MPRSDSSRVFIPLLISTLLTHATATHVCNTNDLTAFCLQTFHFKNIVEAINPPIYPQFTKILEHFPNVRYPSTSGDSSTRETIYTFQDLCEVKYVIARFAGGSIPLPPQASPHVENPYKVDITEIEVDGVRMHNWLHFKIYPDKSLMARARITGKIKMAFLIVHDKQSYPVGDFNHQMPGGSDCNCKYFSSPDPGVPQCKQGSYKDHVPCMFANEHVITHPGQMMFYDEEGVEEIHASWHFAQSQFPTHFITELHVKAILIEDLSTTVAMSPGYVTHDSSNSPGRRTGMFGWQPMYKILRPTIHTVGGWDYFRKGVTPQSKIKSHIPLKSKYYLVEDYPSLGPSYSGGSSGHLLQIVGARHNQYAAKDAQPPKLYWGQVEAPNAPGTDKTDNVRSIDIIQKEIAKLRSLTPVTPLHLKYDRCVCSKIPTTLPPEEVPPPPVQIQGRKSHALQMIIAWLCIIPFGIFVSRYYKETYSKVFFLQEYWWYSIHVLSMFAALMFIYGGIYALEIKRVRPLAWGDKRILIHVILGALAMTIFTVHICVGFFRFRKQEYRVLQIFFHWMFGHTEYVLAMAAMFTSAFIVQGCFPCGAFYYLVGWNIIQILIFIGMEVHMRKVDGLLKLSPKRSYLPPPVMRVFHMNAPHSKFRAFVLLAYAVMCMIAFVCVHMNIKYSDGESCFKARIVEDQ